MAAALRDLKAYTITEAGQPPAIADESGMRDAASEPPASPHRSVTVASPTRSVASPGPGVSVSRMARSSRGHHFNAEVQANNVRLKSAVLELEDLIETTGEVQVEGIRSAEALLKLRVGNSRGAIEVFDAEYRYPTSSRFTREKYIAELELRTSTQALLRAMKTLGSVERAGTRADESQAPDDASHAEGEGVPTPADTSIDARSTADSAVDVAVPDQRCGPAAQAAAREAVRLAEELGGAMDDERRAATAASLGKLLLAFFPPHGDRMARNVTTVHEIAHTDVLQHVRNTLRDGDNALEEAVKAADDADAAFHASLERATDDAGISGAAGLLEDAVKAREHALRVAKSRLSQVLMQKSEDGNLRSTFERARADTTEWLEAQEASKRTLLEDATSDLEVIRRVSGDRAQEHKAKLTAFDAALHRSHSAMEQLGVRQEMLWREVEQRVEEIGRISAERFALVQQHLKDSEAEWKRRRIYDEYVAVHDAHEGHLVAVKGLSELSLEVLDATKRRLDALAADVDGRDMTAGMDDMRAAELRRFNELYPAYAVTANRLLARVDGRALLAGRAARLAASNATLTKDTCDPDHPRYRKDATEAADRAAALEKRSAAIAGSIEFWEAQADAYAAEAAKVGIVFDTSHEAEVAEWEAIIKAARAAEAKLQQLETDAVAADEADVTSRSSAARENLARVQKRRQEKRSPMKQRGDSPGNGAADGASSPAVAEEPAAGEPSGAAVNDAAAPGDG